MTGTFKSTQLKMGFHVSEIKSQIGRLIYFLSPYLHVIVFSPILSPFCYLLSFPIVYLLLFFNFYLHFYLDHFFCSLSFSSHVFSSIPSIRLSRIVWTPMCPEVGCCGIPYLVVSMHSPNTQLTLPSSLFTMPYWVSVDLVKSGVCPGLLRCCFLLFVVSPNIYNT